MTSRDEGRTLEEFHAEAKAVIDATSPPRWERTIVWALLVCVCLALALTPTPADANLARALWPIPWLLLALATLMMTRALVRAVGRSSADR